MSYDIRCVNCGAYLDPCERCDCERFEAEMLERKKASKARKKMVDGTEQAWQEFDYK